MTRVCLESRLGDHFRQQGRLTEVMARYRQEAIQIDRLLEKPQFNAEAQRLAEVRRELFFFAFLRGPLRLCVQIRLALVAALHLCGFALKVFCMVTV